MVYATIRQAKDVVTTEKTTEKTAEKVDEPNLDGKELARSWQGVGKEFGVDFNLLKKIAEFCVEARSLSEIAEHLSLGDRYKMKKKYIDPLLGKCFDMTIPNSPNNPGQKYYLTELGKALLENEKLKTLYMIWTYVIIAVILLASSFDLFAKIAYECARMPGDRGQ